MPALTRPATGNALRVAVRAKRIDIVRLLLDRGVPVNAVDFESVCYSCDPELIQLFLDRGADPISGYPIYRGFQNRPEADHRRLQSEHRQGAGAAASSQHGALLFRQKGKPTLRQSPLMGRSSPRCKDPRRRFEGRLQRQLRVRRGGSRRHWMS